MPRNCPDELRIQDVEMVGQRFKSVSNVGVVWNFSVSTLRPDGSGRVTVKNDRRIDVYWDFEPGQGPRRIRVSNNATECGYLWIPQ
jgi:hypothetical protein